MKNLSVYANNISELIEMRSVAELYGIKVNASGFALCPFHNEDTASMKVYRDGFYCFGCGKGGDIVTFVRDMFDISFSEALEKINCDFSLNLPIGKRMTIREERAYRKRLESISNERRKEAEKKARKIVDYNDLLYSAVNFELDIKRYAPKSPFETPHPLFINAIQNIEYVNFLIDNFDWEEDDT